jgi:hypothetical protein
VIFFKHINKMSKKLTKKQLLNIRQKYGGAISTGIMRAARNLIEKDLKWWYWDDISDLTDIQIMIRMDNFARNLMANEELYRHATATQRSKIRRMLRPETADERRRLSTISRDRHNPWRRQEAAAYRGEREVLLHVYEEAMERQAAYLFLQHHMQRYVQSRLYSPSYGLRFRQAAADDAYRIAQLSPANATGYAAAASNAAAAEAAATAAAAEDAAAVALLDKLDVEEEAADALALLDELDANEAAEDADALALLDDMDADEAAAAAAAAAVAAADSARGIPYWIQGIFRNAGHYNLAVLLNSDSDSDDEPPAKRQRGPFSGFK